MSFGAHYFWSTKPNRGRVGFATTVRLSSDFRSCNYWYSLISDSNNGRPVIVF